MSLLLQSSISELIILDGDFFKQCFCGWERSGKKSCFRKYLCPCGLDLTLLHRSHHSLLFCSNPIPPFDQLSLPIHLLTCMPFPQHLLWSSSTYLQPDCPVCFVFSFPVFLMTCFDLSSFILREAELLYH